MARVGTFNNFLWNAGFTAPSYDLAFIADFLYRCSDFHKIPLSPFKTERATAGYRYY